MNVNDAAKSMIT